MKMMVHRNGNIYCLEKQYKKEVSNEIKPRIILTNE